MSETLKHLLNVDRIIHEPARLMIMAILSATESADFLYLLNATGLTRGNLSSHLTKLEKAGYVQIEKTFVGKIPRTICRLTPAGSEALELYLNQMQTVLNKTITNTEKQ
ncbi:MAG: transcriptional regulator [Chloroflexi bacterium]|nr:MAG: transcriptional regulator [Chloroflexota bacterium]